VNKMPVAFVRVVVWAIIVMVASFSFQTSASAVTLSYDYSGTGSVNFQSDETLNIGGTCSSPCAISLLVSISGTGPAASPASGWATTAFTTISDNLGANLNLSVNAGDVGTNNNLNGGVFFSSILPSTFDVSTSGLASFLGGPGNVDYSVTISLPAGAYVTPVPAALPLFATGIAALGLLLWRKKQRVQAA
jgi:hypothetical protein